ncbi:FAD-dependent thymidylate synthase [bacterium]|nr:FAD-dependent thymidylate synthase [bacterium]
MKIILAGYNIDAALLSEMSASRERDDLTPETISAAYARISRNPKPVDELRKIARAEVQKARRSNQTIIFAMGHHSVAEHAVFNFDLIDISRLAIEAIEHFRLCSFTEKSQRYIQLKDHYIVPEELHGSSLETIYRQTVRELQDAYLYFSNALADNYKQRHAQDYPEKKLDKQARLCANEDARYILSLATMGQLGMTANARNLELIVRRFATSPLSEVREIGQQLSSRAHDIAPSIILFTQGTEYDRQVYHDLETNARHWLMDRPGETSSETKQQDVTLAGYSDEPDRTLLASLLHRVSMFSYQECHARAAHIPENEALDLVRTAFKHAELYDSVLREFEFVTMHWDLIVSASCFAQLKRHRIASLSCQDYNPDLGVTVPPSIIELGLKDDFYRFIALSEKTYHLLYQDFPEIAPYILTNAHRRRVHFGCNARELYHLSRLREDHHAQWDIRNLAQTMRLTLQQKMPLVTLFLGGKDSYPEIYEQHFGTKPQIVLNEDD